MSANRCWEQTELRARPIRVGGAKPTVTLSSHSESRPFTVSVPDIDNARRLGALLYVEVDVELRLRRDADGIIRDGEVLAVHALDLTSDPAQIWRDWFQENAAEWADVDDVLTELGRRDG